jgi:acetoin utilization deacetylase AcuC-like enzyme
VAAAVATRELGLDRVLIVDWDVHHGNGTQDMFWEDPRVGFFSIHRWPFYPGTGWKDETGTGDALGSTLNLPIEFGLSRKDYIRCFADSLERFAARIRPQLVLVSAGFDSHAEDPVGSLGLEIEDFEPLTDAVVNVADTYADGRLVSVLEGGYNPGILAGCVEIHLRRLLGPGHVE